MTPPPRALARRAWQAANAAPCLLAAALGGCGADAPPPDDSGGPRLAPAGNPFSKLAQWGFFEDAVASRPRPRVVPYEVISTLYADDAEKSRYLFVPEGGTIGYDDEAPWDFPVGTVAIKTFWFPRDARAPTPERLLLETRLLVREPTGWAGYAYLWNTEGTEATLLKAGATVEASWTTSAGEERTQTYHVPTRADCQQCHGRAPGTRPLGPRTRQLDRDHDYGAGAVNQLDHFASLGMLSRAPGPERARLVDPFAPGPVSPRARSWLDANCGHCHTPGGLAESTGFHVGWESTDPATGNPSSWGECKFPTSAGHGSGGLVYDVVPGDPDRSILMFRLLSTDPAVRMPPLPGRLHDAAGVALLRDWIAAMPARACQ